MLIRHKTRCGKSRVRALKEKLLSIVCIQIHGTFEETDIKRGGTPCRPLKTPRTLSHEDTLFHDDTPPYRDAYQSHATVMIRPKRCFKGTWFNLRTPKCLKKNHNVANFLTFRTYFNFTRFIVFVRSSERNQTLLKFGRFFWKFVCLRDV